MCIYIIVSCKTGTLGNNYTNGKVGENDTFPILWFRVGLRV